MSAGVRVQCTAVAVDGRGVVLTGAPSVGKSELALRLIGGGALLIGDDAVEIAAANGRLTAQPPADAADRLFVAGIGPVRVPAVRHPIALALCILLDARQPRDPLPQLDAWEGLPGHWLPRLLLDNGPAAPDKVRLALARWGH